MRREVEASLLHDLGGNVDLQEYACEGCAMSPEACSRECCQGRPLVTSFAEVSRGEGSMRGRVRDCAG